MSSSPYTLHVPAFAAEGDPRALERADLVRDGFSWGACIAPPLWLFWHRHWLLALASFVVIGGLAATLWAVGTRPGVILAVEALLHLLFGFEAASLRRFAYARRGRPVSDIVLASNMAEAEAKSFARWLAPAEPHQAHASAARTAPASPVRAGYEPVLGLFPDAEGRR